MNSSSVAADAQAQAKTTENTNATFVKVQERFVFRSPLDGLATSGSWSVDDAAAPEKITVSTFAKSAKALELSSRSFPGLSAHAVMVQVKIHVNTSVLLATPVVASIWKIYHDTRRDSYVVANCA